MTSEYADMDGDTTSRAAGDDANEPLQGSLRRGRCHIEVCWLCSRTGFINNPVLVLHMDLFLLDDDR